MENRLLLAFVLSLGVFIGWGYIMSLIEGPPPVQFESEKGLTEIPPSINPGLSGQPQSNIKSIYGHSLNISEITELSCDHYEEKLVKIIEPNFFENIIATHHLTLSNDFYIIDGCFDFYK